MTTDVPATAVHALVVRTRNVAADDAVLRALPEMEFEWRSAALSVLLQRDRAAALARLVAMFDSLDDDWRGRLARHAPRLSPGIRLCIASQEETTRLAAVTLMRRARLDQLAYLLVDALCAGCPRTSEQAALGHLELASVWACRPSDDRTELIAALKKAVSGWNAHRRDEVFLACAICSEYLLEHVSELAADTRKPVSRALKRFVRETREPKAAGLVLRALGSECLADAAAENIGSADEVVFLKSLLDESSKLTDQQLESTWARVRRLEWLDDPSLLDRLGDRRISTAVRLVHASGVPAGRKFQFIKHVALGGDTEAARLAVGLLENQPTNDARQVLRTLVVRRGSQLSQLARAALQRTESAAKLHARQPAPANPGVKVINDFWQDCDDLSPADRVRIARALDELGPDFVRFLRNHLSRGTIVEQLRAIGMISEADMLARFELDVQRSARHPDPLVRAAAIERLSQLDGPATRRILRDALHDSDERVQASAIESVERLDMREAAPKLVAALRSPSSRVRANAIKALWRFGRHEMIQEAEKMLGSDAAADRLSGLWIVESVKLPGLSDRLRELAANDADGRVRRRAGAALRRLSDALPDAPRDMEEALT